MQTSIFLAQLIGPTLAVIGLGMLVNREAYREMAEEFLDNRALIYLAGVLALVPGLAIVILHNVWVFDWRLIVTLFGWLAVIGGIFRLLLPQQVSEMGSAILDRPAWLTTGGIVCLALGGVLSFYGYVG